MRKVVVLAALALLAGPVCAQPGVEVWKPLSTTAEGITGTIRLSPVMLKIGKVVFPLKVSTDVKLFKAGMGTFPARILEVTTPMDPELQGGDQLCGNAPVQWLAVYRTGKGELGMSVFSKGARPTSDDSDTLCSTFSYVK